MDLTKLIQDIENRVDIGLKKSSDILLDELKKLTPEDTTEMVKSYKVGNIEKQGEIRSIEVGNTAEHSKRVEWGGQSVYNYHKPGGPDPRPVIYRGQGNRTFARATDNKRNQIDQIILNSLKG